jgi:hypothetical protein
MLNGELVPEFLQSFAVSEKYDTTSFYVHSESERELLLYPPIITANLEIMRPITIDN